MCPSGQSLRHHNVSSAASSSFRKAFDVLDVDHDGKISSNDLCTFYSGFGRDIAGNEDVIGTMMTVADTNKDGFVEYDEFERVLLGNSQKRPLGSTVMEDVFRMMDKDGDGKLSHNDLKSYMAWAGFDATDEDINAMIKLGGADQNGGVSFDGLLQILAVDIVV
ncbi:hypothetical protein L6164_011962 [Bauhinia variegata]|uniref:Uncharacterized protein n=1 Tax=Bauhinia variegata TaxID=167791 RepID=A0ACB9P7L6_BAUVA|nr:hypothetical protein L6164_011962 [Bauhinia variegata]